MRASWFVTVSLLLLPLCCAGCVTSETRLLAGPDAGLVRALTPLPDVDYTYRPRRDSGTPVFLTYSSAATGYLARSGDEATPFRLFSLADGFYAVESRESDWTYTLAAITEGHLAVYGFPCAFLDRLAACDQVRRHAVGPLPGSPGAAQGDAKTPPDATPGTCYYEVSCTPVIFLDILRSAARVRDALTPLGSFEREEAP